MIVTKEFVYVDLNRKQAEHMGAVWNEAKGKYRLPNTIGVLKELDMMGISSGKYLAQKVEQRRKLMNYRRLDDAPGDKRLRPYQRADIDYLARIGSAGIFNEQRTGKTPTFLLLAERKKFKRIMIICPASLVINWKEEADRWTDYNLVSVQGTKKQRNKQYIDGIIQGNGIVISYETLRNDVEAILIMLRMHPLDAIAVDEAHRLRGFKVRGGAKAAKAVMQIGYVTPFRYALTGTPTVKEGQEIWKILHFLYPTRFPGYWQFLERYFKIGSNGFGREVKGYKRKDELQEIVSLISVNRKRKDVMQWIPDKQYQTIRLDMLSKQQKIYKSVEDTFIFEDKIDAPSVLAQLTRLRQVSTCPDILVKEAKGNKEQFLIDWLEDNEGEKVVIFSTFSSYLKNLHQKLKKKYPGTGIITGEVSQARRDQFVKRFQDEKSGCDILLCNIKAAGTGLTLDAAGTVIFLDKEYNPADNIQAEDRITPTNKDRNLNTNVISLVSKDSVDEMIEVLLAYKHDITDVINSGGMKALKRLWEELK